MSAMKILVMLLVSLTANKSDFGWLLPIVPVFDNIKNRQPVARIRQPRMMAMVFFFIISFIILISMIV